MPLSCYAYPTACFYLQLFTSSSDGEVSYVVQAYPASCLLISKFDRLAWFLIFASYRIAVSICMLLYLIESEANNRID